MNTPKRKLIIEKRHGLFDMDWATLWEYRELLYALVGKELKVRYKQTVIGVSWVVLQPLFMVLIFTAVFGRLAKMPSDGVWYPVFSMTALLPWTYFSQAITRSGGSLVANAQLVSKIYFPRILLPLATMPGGGSTAGSALVRHAGVNKISFTGSTEIGKQVMRDAADTVKRVTLELGGKSPNIIFADADLKAAIRGAQTGIFYGKGEVCAAGSRLLVEQSVKDQVVEQLVERSKKLQPGDPLDKNTRLGAVVSKAQQETVLSYIESGKEQATLVAGGNARDVNGKGYFVEATVFDDAKPGMKIVDEEIFGPVLAVMSFDDVEQGIALANETMYGLAAGIWTKDIQKAHRVAREIQAGTVWINTYNMYDPAAPFGGYKASGFGRDLGRESLDGFLETKSVWVGL